MKPKILVFVSFYLPGYKAGGPLRTIANMIDSLSDEFEFWIITRDRDLGEVIQYADVHPDQWQHVGNAMVYYLPTAACSVNKIGKLIADTPHDVLYLNSFLDPIFTIKPLVARMLGWLPDKPVILAPRGEFSSGALQLKYLKKRVYITISKLFDVYKNIIWQASSEYEAQDIVRAMNVDPDTIHIALDLPNRANLVPSMDVPLCPESNNVDIKIVFLSRISPKKNLDYALKTLCKVKARVNYDIYGPAENEAYWNKCKDLIDQLPENISVKYLGSVHPEQVAAIFSRYDLFFFPTLGENYGHVIAESLSVGTPVLLSDQTPWRDLQADRLGWDIPLEDSDRFVSVIDNLSSMSKGERNDWRAHIRQKIVERLTDPQVIEANRQLFKYAIFK